MCLNEFVAVRGGIELSRPVVFSNFKNKLSQIKPVRGRSSVIWLVNRYFGLFWAKILGLIIFKDEVLGFVSHGESLEAYAT